MAELILCEFRKLKRRRILWLVAFAACLFPVPVVLLSYTSGGGAEGAFETASLILLSWIGVPLMVPFLAGLLAALLFCTEQDNGTLKNLYTIPVRPAALALAKVAVIFLLAVVFTLLTFLAALAAAVGFGFSVAGLGRKLAAAVLVGLFYAALSLPAVFLVLWLRRGMLLSVLLSGVYAVVLETLTWRGVLAISNGRAFDPAQFSLRVAPMLIFRWYSGFVYAGTDTAMTAQEAFFSVPTWQVAAVCAAVAALCLPLILWVWKRREV
ncbi:ABC transporter permease [uncultured Subdoligranulum sp.]|uniref:ABC transporter permease n=1 Tax=uncultured Subdoligranulum sp. TaxID=512298 RepID=UPI00262CC401|nr:ABC transporter permease [uncultured Subdoligranulum sp.]